MCSLMPFTKSASHANGSGWNDPSRALQTIRVSFHDEGKDDQIFSILPLSVSNFQC